MELDAAMTRSFIRLEDDQLERLADLLAERLERTASAQDPLVDARELARLMGVTRSFVYEHARDLGAIRLGPGTSPRLRFDPAVAVRAMRTKFSPEPAAAPVTGPRLRPRKRGTARARHPFLEPTAVWYAETGLWKDRKGYPTNDQCWRSPETAIGELVAGGPEDEEGATHHAWEVARREWRKEHRQPGRRGSLASGQASGRVNDQ